MKPEEIYKAKDPDLRASFIALQRAAGLARQVAIQTNTAIIVMQNGKLVRIPASQLRKEEKA